MGHMWTLADWLGLGFGARGRIRTCGLRLRRPSLYPAELHAHFFNKTTSASPKPTAGQICEPKWTRIDPLPPTESKRMAAIVGTDRHSPQTPYSSPFLARHLPAEKERHRHGSVTIGGVRITNHCLGSARSVPSGAGDRRADGASARLTWEAVAAAHAADERPLVRDLGDRRALSPTAQVPLPGQPECGSNHMHPRIDQKSSCRPNFAKRPGRMVNGFCHREPYVLLKVIVGFRLSRL